MSKLNGDKARFQKDRKRKVRHRQRIRTLVTGLGAKRIDDAASREGALAMLDEGGPTRAGD
jgi:hypothetical protein